MGYRRVASSVATMTPEEFRRAGHELIDWIADQRTAVPGRPVLAQVAPGDVRAGFETAAPTEPTDLDTVLARLDEVVVPGITQVQHPMHFGWFPSNASLASVLGDIASSGLGTLGISWESCPALTEVEEVVCEWMAELCGLTPDDAGRPWSGAIHDTASTACLASLLVAREQASAMSQHTTGLAGAGGPFVVYTTDQAHSSVAKAALLAGFGWDQVRAVPTDPWTRAMRPDALAEQLAADLAAGAIPAAVVATIGTTGTTAIDPVDEIVAVVRAADTPAPVWVHVDAAMAGSAMMLPECAELFAGVEGADAIAWNPHKWMGTILDTALLYVRDVELMERVMATDPSYLRSSADGAVTQLRNRGVPLGRRFRALKLWFHLELDGVEAIRERLRRDLANASWFEAQVVAADDWELVAPRSMQTVCLRHRPTDPATGQPLEGDALDAHTLAWVDRLNRSGAAYCTPSLLDGRWMVRVSIGVEATERTHVEALWALLQDHAAGV